MDWNKYTDVSNYFKNLIGLYIKPIKFIELDTSKGATQITSTKDSEFPILIIDEIKGSGMKPQNAFSSFIDSNVISLLIFEKSKTADFNVQNAKYDSAKEIAYDFVAKINDNLIDESGLSLERFSIENTDFDANIIGVQLDLHIKGKTIELNTSNWK